MPATRDSHAAAPDDGGSMMAVLAEAVLEALAPSLMLITSGLGLALVCNSVLGIPLEVTLGLMLIAAVTTGAVMALRAK